MKKELLMVALAAAITSGVAVAQDAAPGKEKCYGIAAAGKNDCATGKHSCAGLSTTKAADEWQLVDAGTCEKEGGTLTPPTSAH